MLNPLMRNRGPWQQPSEDMISTSREILERGIKSRRSLTSYAKIEMDYDGDALFGVLTLDNWSTDELKYLAPHYGAWSLDAPRKIAGNIAMPKPVMASTLSVLYNRTPEDDKADPNKLKIMKRMFDMRTM